ncbi:MAG: hypothetical protein DHS20C20_31100 [Ardenticatenaceae bacterium]|nr:MAG: hypothetical protein DHS20C20_31100 [Ardenticatenaceae bacterium]
MRRPQRLQRLQYKTIFKGLILIENAIAKEYTLRFPAIFIVSPPRSGTTLTRQVLAWSFPTSYFSNFTSMSTLHVGRPLPITTAYLVKRFGQTDLGSFENSYGRTLGRSAPAEGETIWGHWFGKRYEAVDPQELTPEQQAQMYRAVAATENILGAPFLNKTTTLSLRIRAIVKTFPKALFIQVTRNQLDSAQSIYLARTNRYHHWLGAMPKECEASEKKSIVEQVCDQIYYIEKNIAYERSIIGDERFTTVAYKDLCENPTREVGRIVEFLAGHGVPAKISKSLPDSFKFSHGQKIDETPYLVMKHYLESLYSQ